MKHNLIQGVKNILFFFLPPPWKKLEQWELNPWIKLKHKGKEISFKALKIFESLPPRVLADRPDSRDLKMQYGRVPKYEKTHALHVSSKYYRKAANSIYCINKRLKKKNWNFLGEPPVRAPQNFENEPTSKCFLCRIN